MLKIKNMKYDGFVPGRWYSVIGLAGQKMIINGLLTDSSVKDDPTSYGLTFLVDGKLKVITILDKEQKVTVIEHYPGKFFIGIGFTKIIGNFDSREEAGNYLKANKDMLTKIPGSGGKSGWNIRILHESLIASCLSGITVLITKEESLEPYIKK